MFIRTSLEDGMMGQKETIFPSLFVWLFSGFLFHCVAEVSWVDS